MRLLRYIVSISIITLTALIYVHQQIELVKSSYEIECREKALKQMLDHREILRYNISNLESSSRLEKILLSHNIKISIPKRAQIVRSAAVQSQVTRGNLLGVSSLEERAGIFRLFDFLGGRAEAHAREK